MIKIIKDGIHIYGSFRKMYRIDRVSLGGSRDKVKMESEQEVSNYWGNWPGHAYTFDLVYLYKYLKTLRLKISGILAADNV